MDSFPLNLHLPDQPVKRLMHKGHLVGKWRWHISADKK
jgi:hypothetical protein